MSLLDQVLLLFVARCPCRSHHMDILFDHNALAWFIHHSPYALKALGRNSIVYVY